MYDNVIIITSLWFVVALITYCCKIFMLLIFDKEVSHPIYFLLELPLRVLFVLMQILFATIKAIFAVLLEISSLLLTVSQILSMLDQKNEMHIIRVSQSEENSDSNDNAN